MLLGVDPGTRRTETVETLDRGVTVLLFTDGLIERRHADIDAGMDGLLAALADRPLHEVCDRVTERMVDGHPDHDVARGRPPPPPGPPATGRGRPTSAAPPIPPEPGGR